MKSFVDYYFKRLEFWKKQLKLKGYTQKMMDLARKDTKEYLKEK